MPPEAEPISSLITGAVYVIEGPPRLFQTPGAWDVFDITDDELEEVFRSGFERRAITNLTSERFVQQAIKAATNREMPARERIKRMTGGEVPPQVPGDAFVSVQMSREAFEKFKETFIIDMRAVTFRVYLMVE